MVDGVGMLLVSSIGGYWVLERSVMHKGPLKKVGQWLGALVIVLSLLGVACKMWYASTQCAWSGRGRQMCPYPKSFAPGAAPKMPSMPMDDRS